MIDQQKVAVVHRGLYAALSMYELHDQATNLTRAISFHVELLRGRQGGAAELCAAALLLRAGARQAPSAMHRRRMLQGARAAVGLLRTYPAPCLPPAAAGPTFDVEAAA